MFVGIDCGTQGTKAVVYDHRLSRIIGQGYEPHQLISSCSGGREQKPVWWVDALDTALDRALSSPGVNRAEVLAIGLSGQQHGAVLLDKHLSVIRDAKLWNDTETAEENADLITRAGGILAVISMIGTQIPVGYTVSKLLWSKKHEPELYGRIAHVLTPKDYLNYYLTGVLATDVGSASGTGYFDVVSKKWSSEMLELVDETGFLNSTLPPVADETVPLGVLRQDVATKHGLSDAVLVSLGSGDNMMAAIGTGNVVNGVGALNLGTSGVLNVYTDSTPVGYPEIVQIQNSATGGWLPTVCTMNATSTSNALQKLFGVNVETLNEDLASAEIGADGITFIPFLNGERMPALPHSRGTILGLTSSNFSRRNLVRAGVESVVFGLRWGCDLLTTRSGSLEQIRIAGGGSNSKIWRQIVANVFDSEVVGTKSEEAGALGAAIQAMSITGLGPIAELCERFVELDWEKRALPVEDQRDAYHAVYQRYLAARAHVEGI